MKITRDDLQRAADAGHIDTAQVEALWRFLSESGREQSQFRAAHILYYLGGFVAMAALGLFIGQAWEDWVGWPMFALALGFAGLGIALTHWFLDRKQLNIPAGVLLTFSISMTPLAIFNLQHALGFWQGGLRVTDYHHYIDWRWIFMELGTLAAAVVALWRYRLPFTVFLVALTLWYLQMDLVPFLFHNPDAGWQMRKTVSVVMGLITMGIGFWVDVRSGRRRDYGFWLYLFGVMAFWGGLSAMDSQHELGKLFYCLVNLMLIAAGTALRRRVLAVFGALGVAAYLSHLADLFTGSLLFPVALAVIGIGIVFVGLYWQRNEERIAQRLVNGMPGPLASLLQRVQGGA